MSANSFAIGRRQVGFGHPCLIIGEVAQAHDGSLGAAHAYIDAIARAGVDAVKFQTHIAAAESTPEEPWRVKFSPQDASRYDYWKRMEFTEAQWMELRRHAEEKNLLFLSSPFSIQAVKLLERTGVAAWKIPSGEIRNTPLLDAVLATKFPVILSSGMSSLSEIDAAVGQVRKADIPLLLMVCTSLYPTPPGKTGLNLLALYRERYGCPVGLSDHSGTIFAGLAAAALSAHALEIHVTFSREAFGPDVPASVTTAELHQLVEGIRFIDKALANPVDKDALAQTLAPLRQIFGQSVVASRDLASGTQLRAEDLATKKPGTGIPAERLNELVGKRTRRDVQANQLLTEYDIE